MLEKNPELEFKLSIFRAFVAAGGDVVIADKRSRENDDYHFNVSDEWELVESEEKPVTFIEAFKEAAMDGKEIRYEKWSEYYPATHILEFVNSHNAKTAYEIISGKWYVKEE